MAADAYLKIEGINGESTDDKHRDWIEINSVLYAINQPRAESISTAGGMTSGRAGVRKIKWTYPPEHQRRGTGQFFWRMGLQRQ